MSAAEERLGNDPTSELWGEHRSRYRCAAQYVADKRVLDVACGSGFGIQILSEAGAHVFGVDYDASAIHAIRRRRGGASLIRSDALRLPLETACMDVVVSFETIEHVPDAGSLIREVRRVLRPGGCLVLSTPNRAFGPTERHVSNTFHVREFTADELRDVLSGCFKEVHLYGQWPVEDYRYVPFLMLNPDWSPSALMWKLQARLPYAIKNRIALALSGRPFYPSEDDYCFREHHTAGSHALVAVAQ